MERAGPEVDQRVGGEQRRGHGRPGGPRAAVLHQHLERQQGQHPPRRLEAEAAPPASAHAGPHPRHSRPPQSQSRTARRHPQTLCLKFPHLPTAERHRTPFISGLVWGILDCFFLRAQGKGLMAARRANLPEDSSGLAPPLRHRFASPHRPLFFSFQIKCFYFLSKKCFVLC